MNVWLHQIETLVPEHGCAQDFIREKMESWYGDARMARMARQVFRKSGIEKRHSVLPDFTAPERAELYRPSPDGKVTEPSTGERNRLFMKAADALSVAVARRALNGGHGFGAADITHVVTVSCTGFHNPGPDVRLVTELGLSPSTERYHLGFMGCYAAFPALRMAQQFCRAQPQAVVLVVCVELCTLHMQLRPDADSLLANALFADGVACAIVSARPPSGRQPVLALGPFLSALVPDGGRDMAWSIGNSGFNLVLSSYVPDVIGLNVAQVVEDLLVRSPHTREMIDFWAVHPGGKSILDKVEQALNLRPEQLRAARETLRDFGNMSSATLLFVLQRLLAQAGSKPATVCAMAFGPGLTIETGLMELLPDVRAGNPGHEPAEAAGASAAA